MIIPDIQFSSLSMRNIKRLLLKLFLEKNNTRENMKSSIFLLAENENEISLIFPVCTYASGKVKVHMHGNFPRSTPLLTEWRKKN